MGCNPVNVRIIAARFKGRPLNITVVQVYAPTADSTEDDIESKDALDGSDIAMSQLAAYTATMSQHKGNVTMTVVL